MCLWCLAGDQSLVAGVETVRQAEQHHTTLASEHADAIRTIQARHTAAQHEQSETLERLEASHRESTDRLAQEHEAELAAAYATVEAVEAARSRSEAELATLRAEQAEQRRRVRAASPVRGAVAAASESVMQRMAAAEEAIASTESTLRTSAKCAATLL